MRSTTKAHLATIATLALIVSVIVAFETWPRLLAIAGGILLAAGMGLTFLLIYDAIYAVLKKELFPE